MIKRVEAIRQQTHGQYKPPPPPMMTDEVKIDVVKQVVRLPAIYCNPFLWLQYQS